MFLAEVSKVGPRLIKKYVFVDWLSDMVFIKYSLKKRKWAWNKNGISNVNKLAINVKINFHKIVINVNFGKDFFRIDKIIKCRKDALIVQRSEDTGK